MLRFRRVHIDRYIHIGRDMRAVLGWCRADVEHLAYRPASWAWGTGFGDDAGVSFTVWRAVSLHQR